MQLHAWNLDDQADDGQAYDDKVKHAPGIIYKVLKPEAEQVEHKLHGEYSGKQNLDGVKVVCLLG